MIKARKLAEAVHYEVIATRKILKEAKEAAKVMMNDRLDFKHSIRLKKQGRIIGSNHSCDPVYMHAPRNRTGP